MIVLALDTQTMTATLVSSFVHPTPLLAASQGDFQPLPGGNWFVGWGQEPYFSEYSPRGQAPVRRPPAGALPVLHGAQVPLGGRALATAVPCGRARPHGGPVAYVSWNGATPSPSGGCWGARTATLSPAAAPPSRGGFETAIALSSTPRYIAVQALGPTGQVLGASAPVALSAALAGRLPGPARR